MSDNDQNETNKTGLHYNGGNEKNEYISNDLLNNFINYLKRESEPEYPSLYMKDTRYQNNGNNPKIKNKTFIDYGLHTHIIENIVGIDDNNLPYINNEYKSYINSKNIILIIDIYVYNLFFHFKYIGKNINNYYLCFNKIAYPFHFNFHNNNTCENCALKENNNYECKQKTHKDDNDAIGQTPKQCYYNKKGKNKNEFLPKILYMWCERLKLAISIYNDNKIEYMKKNHEHSEKNTFIYDPNSRYSVNECIKKLEEITFYDKSYDGFKNVYFASPICNNILISNTDKSTKLKEKNKPNLNQGVSNEVETKWERKKKDNKSDPISQENNMYDSELYSNNVTDLYLINLVKCKIEEYFKNVQVKKFWNIINVRNLIEFDYKQINKKTNNKIDSNINSRKYNESIYEYIQIIKKAKYKKDIKTNEMTKNGYKIKRNVSHNNITTSKISEKKKLEKEYIIKDMFNNTMKDYNVNEIQIYLSNYDNIFFKTITSFYLLLNFSVEIMSILYENLDLYSYHIFYLYEQVNKYLYSNHMENNIFEIHQKKKDVDSDQNCNKKYGVTNNWQNDKTYINCNSSNVDKNNKKYNFLVKVNNHFNKLSDKDIKFDSAVFFLLKLFIKSKCDEEQIRCRSSDNNTSYKSVYKRLKIEKYKEILKEIKILISYLINKKILKEKHNLNYIIYVCNKYDKKIKELKHTNYVSNKYVDILKKNFLLYSLNFYEFEFFSNKNIDNYLNTLDQSKGSRKIKLKIPSRIYITKTLNKYVTFRKKTLHINKKLYGNYFFKPHSIDSNNITHSNSRFKNGDKSNQVFTKITMSKIKRKQRNIYLRKLASKVYANFKAAHSMYTSFKESGNTKIDKRFNKKKCSYYHDGNDNGYVNEKEIKIFITYHKNGLIKKLNLIKLKHKICNIIRQKNIVYKKVIKKIKEREKINKKSKLRNYEIYYNKFLDIFKNLKKQDIIIRNNLYNMIYNINESLNIYYTNICHCIQSDIFRNQDVEYFMKEKLEILKDGINLYSTNDNVFSFYKNNFNYQNQTGLNNEENDNYAHRNVNPNLMNSNDVFIDMYENNVANNPEIKLINTNSYSSLQFLSVSKNVKKNGFRELEEIGLPFSNTFNDTKLQECIKCHSKLDINLLKKKKKVLYNLFNLESYYKEKKKKINYLAYDINILKEYLYIYLKKFFDDIIILFEYFYFFFSSNTINPEYGDTKGNNVNSCSSTKVDNENKNLKHKDNFDNTKYDDRNTQDIGIYNEEHINSKRSVAKEINNQDNEKSEDLIYEYFFLCSYDNFNNASDLDNINIKDRSKHSKHYMNYILTKKLRLFIKNDLIQFINKNINLINNNINFKIISIKRLYNKVLNSIKLSSSTNNLFIYQILYSMIIKYAKYNQNKLIKKNIMNKLSTWEWNRDDNGDVEKKIYFLKKKKKYLQKFGLDIASLSDDVIIFLKYITMFDSTKLDYSNMDSIDKGVYLQKEMPSEFMPHKNNIKKKRYSSCQRENTSNSFYIDNNEQVKENNIYDFSLKSFFFSLTNCRDVIYLKNFLHKIIKKKKKYIITTSDITEPIPCNKNKCKHINKTKSEEEYFELLSHIYEIVKRKSLKKYDNLKLFITIDKKKKTKKRKLDYDENLIPPNFYNDNTSIMIKKIQKNIIKFIDDNKYVFPYIFNTFDNNTNYELNNYDIINLNHNFIFFHYINNKSEYSYKNSILNYIYGYPILSVHTKNDDSQSCYITSDANTHIIDNNIMLDEKEKRHNQSKVYQECSSKYEMSNCNDNVEPNIYDEMVYKFNKKNVNINEEAPSHFQTNECKMKNFRTSSCPNRNYEEKYYSRQNVERLQKIRRKNQRANLINIFNNVKTFNSIPLKYIHLCVIYDIFKFLNLHHIIQDIIKNLYIEKLKEIQESYIFSQNNNTNLSNILICFLFYFYSYLDILLGIRDGNFINLTKFENFNIFNNFNDIVLKRHKKKKEGNNAPMKETHNKKKNKQNMSEDLENVKQNYIYLDNELSNRSTYLWILKRKEKNTLSFPYVDEIYLKLRNDAKLKNSNQNFSTNLKKFLDLYLDYNYSFLNSAKSSDENKSQFYLVVQDDDSKNLEKVDTTNSVSNCNSFGDDKNKACILINIHDEENENYKTSISMNSIFKNRKDMNVLYDYSNICISTVESNYENYNSSLFLSKINLLNSMRYYETGVCCLQNYELIKKDLEKSECLTYFETDTSNNRDDICNNNLMDRIKFMLDILRLQLNCILDKRKECIINSLTGYKINKNGLEDIKFAYYLVYLLDFEKKQKYISDIYIYKNIYYSLIESLFTKNNNNANGIDCDKIIYIIFNLIKITRIIKIKNKQIRKLFKLLQKYLQNVPDFFFQIFNKIFLFIYQDTKFENKLFLKKYLNAYFNDKRIILHILNHIMTSARSKRVRSTNGNKNMTCNKTLIYDEPLGGSSSFYEKKNEHTHNETRKEERINLNNSIVENKHDKYVYNIFNQNNEQDPKINNKNDMVSKCTNDFPLTDIQHNNNRKNEKNNEGKNRKKKRNTKKKNFSHFNHEIIKKVFLKCKNIYSSDTNNSSNGNIFKIKNIKNQNYKQYEEEKKKYIFEKIKKKQVPLSMSKEKLEGHSNLAPSNDIHIKRRENKDEHIHDKKNESILKNKHFEEYSSDDFLNFVDNIYIRHNKNEKMDRQINMLNVNKYNYGLLYYNKRHDKYESSDTSSNKYTSDSSSDYSTNSSNNKDKLVFDMGDINIDNSGKLLSRLSTVDIKGIKQDEEIKYYETNEYPLYDNINKDKNNDPMDDHNNYDSHSSSDETVCNNNKKNNYFYNFLNSNNNDNSFCFIKYKSYHEFNNKKRRKIKKYKIKEKKEKRNKTAVMYMPLYISIVGGLDFFLYKYYNYICETYINPYFYINTYYFEKYIRKRYKNLRKEDNYLVYDFYYYNYMFLNKFSTFDSFNSIKGKKVEINKYIKFFNFKPKANQNESLICMRSERCNNSISTWSNVKNENMNNSYYGVGNELDVLTISEKKNSNTNKIVDIEESEEERNAHIRSVSINASTENRQEKISKYVNSYNINKNENIKFYPNLNQINNNLEFVDDNFFYTENSLSSDDEEYRARRTDINDIHIFKRNLFIIEYFENYFNFSLLIRMKNILLDMYENYNLNLPYVNKYILINEKNNISKDPYSDINNVLPNFSNNKSKYYKDVCPEWNFVKLNSSKLKKIKEINYNNNNSCLNIIENQSDSSYNNALQEFFYGTPIQISMTILNPEYWKFEALKEDQVLKHIIPECVQKYLNIINNIYQKYNVDKYLIFLYDLCYIDLNINDYMYTFKLPEGLFFLFLSNTENHAIDTYKNSLFFNNAKKDNGNIKYNYDYIFISSNYKHKENKTLHIIINDNIILYDFHIIQNHQSFSAPTKKKRDKLQTGQEWETTEGAETTETNFISSQTKAITKDCQLIKLEGGKDTEKNEHMLLNMSGNNILKETKIIEIKNTEKDRSDEYSITGEEQNKNNTFVNEIKIEKINKRFNSKDEDIKCDNINNSVRNKMLFFKNKNTINKQISRENIYYNLNFLKEFQEKEIEKIKNIQNINDIYIKMFFTEEYLVQNTQFSEKYIKEMLKKLIRDKFLQKNTFKVMNKQNNKTTQFTVYCILDFDTNMDENKIKNKSEQNEKCLEMETQSQTWNPSTLNNQLQTKDSNNTYPHYIGEGDDNGNSIIIETKKMDDNTLCSFSSNTFNMKENCIIENRQLVSLFDNDSYLNNFMQSQSRKNIYTEKINENKIDIHNINEGVDLRNAYNKQMDENCNNIFNMYSNRSESNEYFINRKIKGNKEKEQINSLNIKIGKIVKNNEKIKKDKKNINKLNKLNKLNKINNLSNDQNILVNSLVPYISRSSTDKDKIGIDNDLILGNTNGINEPVDYFLDDVATDDEDEKEIKRRKTFDNLNLEGSYEFYENEILRITKDRMNKMMSEPGKNISTPLFLIPNIFSPIAF
ncbi:conserved Plasmodium protein, unknown function [Plasmodium vinckei brucechwatti]|uniref:Uncharacterized protein n=1 Tax=Plasmodium vinckei brucechwatti TaxID=119398 RepID=A0A6V7SPX3_PLAVN|nr:conserved Plasmodium protein, unknown function [Plasmodium vinckei brucechwatti]